MHPTPLKLVILDRDGTINEDRDDYVKSPDEWVPLPGALEAIARLNHAGWHTVVATNQSGLGRGLFDMASLNAMHLKMNQVLAPAGRAHRCGVLLPAHARRRLRLPQAAAGADRADRRALRRVAGRHADGRRHPARPAGRRGRRLPDAPGADRQERRPRRQAARPICSSRCPAPSVHADLSAFRRLADPPASATRARQRRVRLRLRGTRTDGSASSARCARPCSCSTWPSAWCRGPRWC